MISPRYVPAVCVLLALALIPTIIHSYSRDTETDPHTTSGIAMALAGFEGTPSARNANWGKRRFDSDDWNERFYSSADGRDTLRLTVVRSYDAKTLYHHPELAITYREATFAGEQVRRFAARPDIPVHVLKPAPGQSATGLYALHYDTGFIDNPIAFQIRTAGTLLFSRRKPTTLFFVFADRTTENLEASPALTLLFAAVESFLGRQEPVTAP